jgi:hypothetical protein
MNPSSAHWQSSQELDDATDVAEGLVSASMQRLPIRSSS